MLYNYSDMSKLFETINKNVTRDGGMVYIDEINSYSSYNHLNKLLKHILDGGVTIDDYQFIHSAIAYMNKKESVTLYKAFNGYDPIELKNFYHQSINCFGDKAIELIGSTSIFGHAYVNAMKRCNKSEDELYSIPNAKTVFEEFSKLLKRMKYNGAYIDDELCQYMQ